MRSSGPAMGASGRGDGRVPTHSSPFRYATSVGAAETGTLRRVPERMSTTDTVRALPFATQSRSPTSAIRSGSGPAEMPPRSTSASSLSR